MLGLVLLCGCTPWTWRVGARYSPTAEVPVVTAVADSVLGPEAYAIGSTRLQGRDVDSLLPRLEAQAARAGAHALVIDAVEALTSSWNVLFTPRDTDEGVVVRRETVTTASSSATLEATALRRPEACLGIVATCDRPYAAQACLARVVDAPFEGPAFSAEIRPGNRVISVDGEPVAHPWDLHWRVDREPVGHTFTLRVASDEGERNATVASVPCAGLYPGT